ncbi:MAG: coenzyme A pyrophosphatase [Porticoccaceae bacterium]|nr:MAG: coenzyme A pyrophosphatase [Porticoccaceae bacterium]
MEQYSKGVGTGPWFERMRAGLAEPATSLVTSPPNPVAAVLLPVVAADTPRLLFVRRAERLGKHGGQVAFPGGMWESADDSLIQTALREAEEEIGLSPQAVDLLGSLEPETSIYGVSVFPFVGAVSPPIVLRPEPSEIAAIFEVPLEALLDEARHRLVRIASEGRAYRAPAFCWENELVWGLTYRILLRFLEKVCGFTPPVGRAPVEEVLRSD